MGQGTSDQNGDDAGAAAATSRPSRQPSKKTNTQRPDLPPVDDDGVASEKSTDKKKKKKKKKDKESKDKKRSKSPPRATKRQRGRDPQPEAGPWRFEEHIHHIKMHAPESKAFTKEAFAKSVEAEWRLITLDETDLDRVDRDHIDRYVWLTTGNKPADFPGFDDMTDEQKHIAKTIASGSSSIEGVKFYDFVNFLLLGRDSTLTEMMPTKEEWDMENHFRFHENLDYVESHLPADLEWIDEFMGLLEDSWLRMDGQRTGHINEKLLRQVLLQVESQGRAGQGRLSDRVEEHVDALLQYVEGCPAEDRHRSEHRHAFVLFTNALLAACGHPFAMETAFEADEFNSQLMQEAAAAQASAGQKRVLKASGSSVLAKSTSKHRLKAVRDIEFHPEDLRAVQNFDLKKSLQQVMEQLPEQVDQGPFVMALRAQWLLLDKEKRGLVTVDDVHKFVWAQSSHEPAPAILSDAMQKEVDRLMRETGGADKGYFGFWDLANVHLRSLHIHPDQRVTLGPNNSAGS